MKKRLLAILIVFAMLFSYMPVYATGVNQAYEKEIDLLIYTLVDNLNSIE